MNIEDLSRRFQELKAGDLRRPSCTQLMLMLMYLNCLDPKERVKVLLLVREVIESQHGAPAYEPFLRTFYPQLLA